VLTRQGSTDRYLEDNEDVGAYVILDDQTDDFDAGHPHLIACHPKKGLSEPAVVAWLRAALQPASNARGA